MLRGAGGLDRVGRERAGRVQLTPAVPPVHWCMTGHCPPLRSPTASKSYLQVSIFHCEWASFSIRLCDFLLWSF